MTNTRRDAAVAASLPPPPPPPAAGTQGSATAAAAAAVATTTQPVGDTAHDPMSNVSTRPTDGHTGSAEDKGNLGVLRNMTAEVSNLLLFAYVKNGHVYALNVNNNPVSSEITSLIQNVLTGNPLNYVHAEAFQLGSSSFSVIFSNRPEDDSPIRCKPEDPNSSTDTILVDAISGMNGVVKKPGPCCVPFADSDDICTLRKLSPLELNSLLSNRVSTKEGRIAFTEKFNSMGFKKKFVWSEADESKLDGKDSFFIFMVFKERFHRVCTLMISNEEANHRLQAALFTWARLKCHPLSIIQTEKDPSPGEMLSVEYLQAAVNGIDQNVLHVEGRTTRYEETEVIMKGLDPCVSTIMTGVISIPLRPNSNREPIDKTLGLCRRSSASYSKSKLNSSDQTPFQVGSEILYDGFGGDCGVMNQVPTLNLPGKKGVSRANHFNALDSEGNVVEIKMKHEGNVTEIGKVVSCLVAVKKPTVWFQDGQERIEFPFHETFKMLLQGKKSDFDVIEINLLVVGSKIFRLCLGCAGFDNKTIENFLRKCAECGYFNLSSDPDTGLPDDESVTGTRLGHESSRYLAAGILMNAFYIVGSIYGRKKMVLDFLDDFARGRKDMTPFWNGLRSHLGLTLILTNLQYVILKNSDPEGLKTTQTDASFLRNMLYFNNVENLIRMIDAFGYSPRVRGGVTPGQFTSIKSIQDLFQSPSMTHELYGAARQDIEQATYQGLGDLKSRRKFQDSFLLQAKGWNFLVGKNASLVDSGGGNLLLEMIRIYVIDLARKIFLQERNGKLDRDGSIEYGTWLWGRNKFGSRNNKGNKRKTLVYSKENDDDDIFDEEPVPIALNSPRLLNTDALLRIAESIFIPVANNSEENCSKKSSLGLEITVFPEDVVADSGTSRKKMHQRKRTKARSEDDTASPGHRPRKQMRVVVTPNATGEKSGQDNKAGNDMNRESAVNTESSGGAPAEMSDGGPPDDRDTSTIATGQTSISSVIDEYKTGLGEGTKSGIHQSILILLQHIEEDPKYEELRSIFLNAENAGEGEDSGEIDDDMDDDTTTLFPQINDVRNRIMGTGRRLRNETFLLLHDIFQHIKMEKPNADVQDRHNEIDFHHDQLEDVGDGYEDQLRSLETFVRSQMLPQRFLLHTSMTQNDGSTKEEVRCLNDDENHRDMERFYQFDAPMPPNISVHMSTYVNESGQVKVMGYLILEDNDADMNALHSLYFDCKENLFSDFT